MADDKCTVKSNEIFHFLQKKYVHIHVPLKRLKYQIIRILGAIIHVEIFFSRVLYLV